MNEIVDENEGENEQVVHEDGDCDRCLAYKAQAVKARQQLASFKRRVRERAIAEADRRGWCGEFDDVIRELGMSGRWNNYVVVFRLMDEATASRYERVFTLKCLARSETHARTLATSQMMRSYGAVYECIGVDVDDSRR
jgi:hypothetical protein